MSPGAAASASGEASGHGAPGEVASGHPATDRPAASASARSDPGAAESARLRRLAALGDALASASTDETGPGWSGPPDDEDRDDALLREVPPHHG